MIARVFWLVFRVFAALFASGLFLINGRLYAAPPEAPDAFGSDVEPELHFVGRALREGSAEKMQNAFPEGYVFDYALYAGAWAQYGLGMRPGSTARDEATREAEWALAAIEGDEAKRPFTADLDPPYGIFYAAWVNWTRGVVVDLSPEREIVDRYEAGCTRIAAALDASPTPFLASYPGHAWPVDSVVAVAGLALHDKILKPRFATTIAAWIAKARARSDGPLLAHEVDATTGAVQKGPRGSSESLILRFLPEINAAWGHEAYAAFRARFLATTIGLPGIREYPIGATGPSDVDSGPLVFGISPSATVVAVAAARMQNDVDLATALVDVGEALGLPWGGEEKKYAFGLWPIGDAFIVWSKTSYPLVGKIPSPPPSRVSPDWRWPFHVASLALAVSLWIPSIAAWLAIRARRRRAWKALTKD